MSTVRYIKYGNVQLPIDTEKGPKELFPLATVYDLIQAYKVAVKPLLDDISIAYMTLFTVDNSVNPPLKTLLNWSDPIPESAGCDRRFPLILESNLPDSASQSGGSKDKTDSILEKLQSSISEVKSDLATFKTEIDATLQKNSQLEKQIIDVKTTVEKYVEKLETVQISQLDFQTIKEDGYRYCELLLPTPDLQDFDPLSRFEWPVEGKENDPVNTEAYLKYFTQFTSPFVELTVQKSINSPFLNATVGVNKLHNIRGKADLYVFPRIGSANSSEHLVMVLELKPRDLTNDNIAQAIGYVIAANSLFDQFARPSPVGVLSNFMDEWVLIYVNPDGDIVYSRQEEDSARNRKPLSRESALFYISQHFKRYNQLLEEEFEEMKIHGKRKREGVDFEWAFGDRKSGELKKCKLQCEPEDNMIDLLETKEEIALYKMRKRMLRTPSLRKFAEAAEPFVLDADM